jgi:DNA-binding Lrp family transcriptional regulator
MSIKIQNRVWLLDLPSHLKYVAIALADHAHDDGTEARPSQVFLSIKTGLSERQIRRSLHELIDRGVIVRQRAGGRNKATSYAFVLPAVGDLLAIENDRSSTTDRRPHTTGLSAAGDRLTIKNPHVEPKAISLVSEVGVANVEVVSAIVEKIRSRARGNR